MVILDTDHLSLLERKTSDLAHVLQTRLDELPDADITTTIISFEEQMRGWMAALGKARNLKEQINKYHRLKQSLRNFCGLVVLSFNEIAAVEFQRLKKELPRVGTMDLKIGAIALTKNAIVLTRNIRDFSQMTGLKVEDWTKEPEVSP